jgi:hypothetical protein
MLSSRKIPQPPSNWLEDAISDSSVGKHGVIPFVKIKTRRESGTVARASFVEGGEETTVVFERGVPEDDEFFNREWETKGYISTSKAKSPRIALCDPQIVEDTDDELFEALAREEVPPKRDMRKPLK